MTNRSNIIAFTTEARSSAHSSSRTSSRSSAHSSSRTSSRSSSRSSSRASSRQSRTRKTALSRESEATRHTQTSTQSSRRSNGHNVISYDPQRSTKHRVIPYDSQDARSRTPSAHTPKRANGRTRASRNSQHENTRAATSRTIQQTSSRKRQRTKERADRLFTRQYERNNTTQNTSEDAPRAAVYTGHMGTQQRKATRMQQASSAGSVSAKLNPVGWFSKFNLSSHTAKLVTTTICVILICAFLYTPAQQYYQATRENARLQAEFNAVEQRNEALELHNSVLSSDAGMEDAVRQKFGYVPYGEQTAVVTGLSDEVSASAKASADVEATILASSVKADEEWYTPFLDAVFGVQ